MSLHFYASFIRVKITNTACTSIYICALVSVRLCIMYVVFLQPTVCLVELLLRLFVFVFYFRLQYTHSVQLMVFSGKIWIECDDESLLYATSASYCMFLAKAKFQLTFCRVYFNVVLFSLRFRRLATKILALIRISVLNITEDVLRDSLEKIFQRFITLSKSFWKIFSTLVVGNLSTAGWLRVTWNCERNSAC